MNFKIAISSLLLLSMVSYAGDNGSKIVCKSASGRTVVEIYDQQVFEDEDHPTNQYSAVINVQIDSAVAQYNVGGYSSSIFEKGILYKEADTKIIELTRINKNKMQLQGVDPRTNEQMKAPVSLVCLEIANPI